jgi:hypothetical protein
MWGVIFPLIFIITSCFFSFHLGYFRVSIMHKKHTHAHSLVYIFYHLQIIEITIRKERVASFHGGYLH